MMTTVLKQATRTDEKGEEEKRKAKRKWRMKEMEMADGDF